MGDLKPVVKWAGGKRQLLKKLKEKVPNEFNRYFEPFIGGGALLLGLQPKDFVIADINSELINMYEVIRSFPLEFIYSLEKYISCNNEEDYIRIRSISPNSLNYIERASRFVYLNKTGFNGLYRQNNKGIFNVPFGNYKKMKLFDQQNIISISEYFNNNIMEIYTQDYKDTIALAQTNDLVYLDPPYHKEKNNSFTRYYKKDFDDKEQLELANCFIELDSRGCHLIMSNANTTYIKRLYGFYNIEILEATRSINANGSGRGKKPRELLITNF